MTMSKAMKYAVPLLAALLLPPLAALHAADVQRSEKPQITASRQVISLAAADSLLPAVPDGGVL